MKISYAVTVCNEFFELKKLLPLLIQSKREEDEIVVLYDSVNGSLDVEEYLRSMSIAHPQGFVWISKPFQNNFADWKNMLTRLCTGDYIFNIDADEIPHESFLERLPAVLEQNPNVDLYLVPRINTVEDITEDHVRKWGWSVNNKGWVNFPDYQSRIYRKGDDIKWINKVHERVVGAKNYSYLPDEEYWCLYHPKTIEKQEKQNNLYNQL